MNHKEPENRKASDTATRRKRVETAFSDITQLMLKSILAVTPEGFIIKLIAFIWAFTFNNSH